MPSTIIDEKGGRYHTYPAVKSGTSSVHPAVSITLVFVSIALLIGLVVAGIVMNAHANRHHRHILALAAKHNI